ncbi:glycine-rich domain-containing protein [Ovoidimarina sediminis]|uniref:hypothetical protein n=1 Tax=Ovoidimarina sediminis TaxID=3079856 RepID=UPI00291492FA|nr:hypothetical protein [Rhodophyticola sp. MJ-SS7]MDU8942890.1 hypothetical protein [Rhodophyticola sp. MJ-SS7]
MSGMTNPALWERLEAHALDDPAVERPYTAKLAADAGWSQTDAARVAGEYRRFLYITQVVEAPPAPPDPIDEAWRTHLLYTEDYWERLVPDVLGRPLHRDPETATDVAAQKRFWKAARPAYAAAFGAPPPPDIWVDPRAPTMGGTIGTLMILGIGGGLLSFFLMFLVGWILGIDVGGPVETRFEKVFTAIFMICWAMAFLSPVWAWLVTRGQKRLKSRRRPKPGSVGFSIGYERS